MAEKDGSAKRPPSQLDSSQRNQKSADRTTRRRFLRSGLAATGALATALYVKPEIRSVGIPNAFAAMSPMPVLPTEHHPICIDFDESFVHPGDVVRNQYLPYGFRVSTKNYWGFDNPHHPAVIFNSANPTGGDYDLGTPNIAFGGPGLGSGGGPGPGANQIAQKQILIIHEGWTPLSATWVYRPDDNAAGGRLVFTFDAPVTIEEVHLLDVDDGSGYGSRVRTYNAPLGGSILFDYKVPNLGNNSFQVVNLNDNPTVRRLEVILRGSGAIARLCYRNY
ncbi:MAG: hypothetical protein ACE5Q6_10490 [Dehalococcoidia bacterium]